MAAPARCGALLASAVLAAAVAACSGAPKEDPAEVGLVKGFAGIVAADEPRAATLGRDILGNGGNAADAAVAMYFAMSVTLPSRAGLGGGGVCVIFDNSARKAESLQFLPRASGAQGVVPQAPRAMAALHARHGLLPWGQLLSPAESMARFGHPVSRAFVRDLAAVASRIAAEPEMSRIFRNNAGELPGEGDKIVQQELASVLSGLRAQGAAYLYRGPFTRRFAEAATAAGQPMTPEEVRGTVPDFTDPVVLDFGNRSLFFTAPPAAGGLLAAQLWQILAEVADYGKAEGVDRAHLFAEASARAFAQRTGWLTDSGEPREAPESLLRSDHLKDVMKGYSAARHTPAAQLSPRPVALAENPHGASFVVGDRWSNAVACSFTMNGLFGAFRMAPGTGILLAGLPQAHYNGILSPAAAILANTNTGETFFAGAASGGSAAPTSLAAVMLGALIDEAPLDEVLARPRLNHPGAPDITFYEAGLDRAVLAGLQSRGHLLREAPGLGRANAFYCPDSLSHNEHRCQFAYDRRGWGLGFIAQ